MLFSVFLALLSPYLHLLRFFPLFLWIHTHTHIIYCLSNDNNNNNKKRGRKKKRKKLWQSFSEALNHQEQRPRPQTHTHAHLLAWTRTRCVASSCSLNLTFQVVPNVRRCALRAGFVLARLIREGCCCYCERGKLKNRLSVIHRLTGGLRIEVKEKKWSFYTLVVPCRRR